jgi:hypothetical protein
VGPWGCLTTAITAGAAPVGHGGVSGIRQALFCVLFEKNDTLYVGIDFVLSIFCHNVGSEHKR